MVQQILRLQALVNKLVSYVFQEWKLLSLNAREK